MSAVFLKILNMGIATGWLILAVALARLLLKKAPRWLVCLLWAPVGVRLALPFSLESALSLIPSRETVPADIASLQQPVIHSGVPFVNAAVNPVLAQSLSPSPVANVNPLQVLLPLFALLWLVGIAVLLVAAMFRYTKLVERVSASVPLGVGVYACDGLPTPFLLGLWRPRIYVPSGLDGETLDHVLRHERAHIRRRDHWWKPLGYLLLVVYWFHPLCWLAYALFCRDMELACDEAAIRGMDRTQLAAYSQALLDCSLPGTRFAAGPLAFGELGVKQRVRHVLHYKKPAFWLILAALLALAVLLAGFLTDPKTAPPPEAQALSDPFGKQYRVAYAVYDAGRDVLFHSVEDAPLYWLTEERELRIAEDPEAGAWLSAGVLEETELSRELFNLYYRGLKGTDSRLYRENARAWRLLIPDPAQPVFYDLLQQTTGELFLCCGSYDYGEAGDLYSDDSSVKWVVKLERDASDLLSDPAPDLEVLRTKYPEYFDLPTGKGLEVYVWAMSPGSYSFGLLPGTNREKTYQELWNLKGASLTEMRAILSSYAIPEDQVAVILFHHPVSSYAFPLAEDEIVSLRRLLFPALTVNTRLAYAGYTENSAVYSGSLNRQSMAISAIQHLPVYKFDTGAELEQFEAAFRDVLLLDQGYAEVPSFQDATSGYDETFFAAHSLALVYVPSGSGSFRYGLQEVSLRGTSLTLYIVQTNTPEVFTADMAGWFVLVELLDAEIGHCTSFDAQLGMPLG